MEPQPVFEGSFYEKINSPGTLTVFYISHGPGEFDFAPLDEAPKALRYLATHFNSVLDRSGHLNGPVTSIWHERFYKTKNNLGVAAIVFDRPHVLDQPPVYMVANMTGGSTFSADELVEMANIYDLLSSNCREKQLESIKYDSPDYGEVVIFVLPNINDLSSLFQPVQVPSDHLQ